MKTFEDLNERTQKCIKLYVIGRSFREIANELGVTRNVIAGITHRNRAIIDAYKSGEMRPKIDSNKLIIDPVTKRRVSVLEAYKDEILDLVSKGKTNAEIARIYGLSDGSVVGKFLKKHGIKCAYATNPSIRAELSKANLKPKTIKPKPHESIQIYKIKEEGEKLEHFPNAIEFLDIKDNVCGYPLWGLDKKTGYVCGDAIKIGERYCQRCKQVVYTNENAVERKKSIVQPRWTF